MELHLEAKNAQMWISKIITPEVELEKFEFLGRRSPKTFFLLEVS